jgi:capsular exopolysaccharide synthesis family protein
MAEGGKKVVLVDCDLRHPSIRNMLPVQEATPGLEEILNGEAELKDALKYYDALNISVLAGSNPVQNASEILGSPKMWEILDELEESTDYVILDSAPSGLLSDASDLAKCADGVIFVVKQDYAKVNQILESLEHLAESSNIEIIGSVLNGATAGLGSYGSYGKYGRHGSYGYSSKKDGVEV